MFRSFMGLTMGHYAGVRGPVKGDLLSAVFGPLLEGHTSQAVSKPGESGWLGARPCALTQPLIRLALWVLGLVPLQALVQILLGFETAWSVRPYTSS